jgi:hypothetical protein
MIIIFKCFFAWRIRVKKLIVIFFLASSTLYAQMQSSNGPEKSQGIILSIQVETIKKKKLVYFYFATNKELLITKYTFGSCMGKTLSVTKQEIEPVEFANFKSRNESFVRSSEVKLEELFKPGFIPPSYTDGYLKALHDSNRLRDRSLYTSLPSDILKIDMTNCFSPIMVSSLMERRTSQTNCFNSTIQFHVTDYERTSSHPGEMEDFVKYCEEQDPEHLILGDIVVYYTLEFLAHAFVYLQDGWVYTKNGDIHYNPRQFQRYQMTESVYKPWITDIKYFRCN